ncbi:hypothetical protein D3C78_1339910 [compost metagenome]
MNQFQIIDTGFRVDHPGFRPGDGSRQGRYRLQAFLVGETELDGVHGIATDPQAQGIENGVTLSVGPGDFFDRPVLDALVIQHTGIARFWSQGHPIGRLDGVRRDKAQTGSQL